MSRYISFMIIAMTAASSVAYAQASRTAGHKGTPEQQRACREDALRMCRGIHEDDAIYACLKANSTRLRAGCREVIEGSR